MTTFNLNFSLFLFIFVNVKGWLIRSFCSFWSFAWLVCYFHYFGSFRVSLIEIWLKFKVKLTLIKDGSFPHLRIHLLYKDQLIWMFTHLIWLTITWSWSVLDLIWCFEWQFRLNGSLLDCYIILVRFSSNLYPFFCIYSRLMLAWFQLNT